MRVRTATFMLLTLIVALAVSAKTSAQRTLGATFEVVSVKPVSPGGGRPLGSSVAWRPDGGFSAVNVAVMTLISWAYPPAVPRDMVDLPGWTATERYDVSATSVLAVATSDDRIAMMRALLADRFKLIVHYEKREQPSFDLVLARRDGRLGTGIKPLDVDCAAHIAAERAAAEARLNAGLAAPAVQRPDFRAPVPRCTLRTVDRRMRDQLGDGLGQAGDLLEGEATMATLAETLRIMAGRVVVDKTGLSGSYALKLNFERPSAPGVGNPPSVAESPGAAPALATAIQEQLGLRLQVSRTESEVLVIDHVERPTEN